MQKIIFTLLLFFGINSIQAVKVKLPSKEILTHRLLSTEENYLLPYLAKKTNLAHKLSYNKLEVQEIIVILANIVKKIKDPIIKERAWQHMGTILRLILMPSSEAIKELITIEEYLEKN